jgi:hypothetical protein
VLRGFALDIQIDVILVFFLNGEKHVKVFDQVYILICTGYRLKDAFALLHVD